jgi:hypothetical protein
MRYFNLKALLTLAIAFSALSIPAIAAEPDPIMDPWQNERASHQGSIDADAKQFKDRWPEIVRERYGVEWHESAAPTEAKPEAAAEPKQDEPVLPEGEQAEKPE